MFFFQNRSRQVDKNGIMHFLGHDGSMAASLDATTLNQREASTFRLAVDKNCRGWNLFSEADIVCVCVFFFRTG